MLSYLNRDTGQLALILRPPSENPQRRHHKHLESNQSRCGISRQGKQWDVLSSLLAGNSGKCGGLSRLDAHASEMDCACQLALDDGLEQVAGAHGGAARGEENVSVVEPLLERVFVGL